MIKRLTISLLFVFLAGNLYSGWFQQVSGVTLKLNSINSHHGNENFAWSCGENGVMLHTSNGGLNWAQQFTGTSNDLYAVCFLEGNGCVMAVGEGGIILRTTNSGLNWVSITSPTTRTLRDISDFNLYIVGDSGTMLKGTNNGLNWVQFSSPTTENLNVVATTFSYYAVGDNGTILKGFGTTWTVSPSGVTSDIFGVPLFGSADITVGDGGVILKSTNFGTSWQNLISGTVSNLRSVEYSVNNTSRIYACGSGGKILKSTTSGTAFGFQITPTTEDLNSIFFYLGDNTGYACGNNGTILKTTDGGGTIFTALNNTGNLLPDNFSLSQNYPNPFNPETLIKFDIPRSTFVKLIIYDITGKEMENLIAQPLAAGSYEIQFNGSAYPSGVYFYSLITKDYSETKKMVLLK